MTTLARRLGTGDATLIGLGSMIGAGVFSAFTPAACAAGSWLLLGLVIAAVVAFCNATSSAQLAAQYPVAGGTYYYGREQLGPWPGFLAGWGFVIGKTASAAAMALTFAAYAVPSAWQRPVAALALAALATVNCFGITRTALLTRVLVGITLAGLAVILVLIWTRNYSVSFFVVGRLVTPSPSVYGVLQSAGLLFFAFAGYARIATLGEEVREPRRTIPRAIVAALSLTVILYAVVAMTLLRRLPIEMLVRTPTPLADIVSAAAPGMTWLVGVVAAVAALGSLLALIAGIGRTSLAMAREGDLPRPLAAVDATHQVPWRAEITVAVIAIVAVLLVDLREVIGFSSFGVLLYYAVANASALRQDSADRRYPKVLQVLGLVGCLVLVATLPWQSVVVGLVVFAVGIGYRLIRLRVHDHRQHA